MLFLQETNLKQENEKKSFMKDKIEYDSQGWPNGYLSALSEINRLSIASMVPPNSQISDLPRP
jgi:hypothetical protein